MPSDTHPDAASVQIELLRKASVRERLSLAMSLTATVVDLSRRAIARAHPEWSEQEVRLYWAEVHYGKDLADRVRDYLRSRA